MQERVNDHVHVPSYTHCGPNLKPCNALLLFQISCHIRVASDMRIYYAAKRFQNIHPRMLRRGKLSYCTKRCVSNVLSEKTLVWATIADVSILAGLWARPRMLVSTPLVRFSRLIERSRWSEPGLTGQVRGRRSDSDAQCGRLFAQVCLGYYDGC
jgi:hypothetical protein